MWLKRFLAYVSKALAMFDMQYMNEPQSTTNFIS